MTAIDLPQKEFQKNLNDLFSNEQASPSIQKIKSRSWLRFQELGLPSRELETYRYVKLRKLYDQTFSLAKKKTYLKEEIQKFILPSCRNSFIVLINGAYYPELSSLENFPDKVFVQPLSQAMQNFGTFLNNQIAKTLKNEKDPFATLNGALNQEGIFFYYPSNISLDTPLQILNLIDAEIPLITCPRIHFFIGAHSKVDLILSDELIRGTRYFNNLYIDLFLEEGAQALLHHINMTNSNESWNFGSIRASLKRNSSFRSTSVTTGCETDRRDYHIQLTGENAEASLNALWVLNKANEAHTNVLIDHQAPNCRSLQLFKGVLDDRSHSSFEGKIYVRQEAQKTDAFQLNNNLLLSDQVQAESKPNLEIFADDVKASHGATVGQVNKEQMFYLAARGISAKEAKKILINGFCEEIINQFHDNGVKEQITQKLESSLCQV